MQPHQSWESSEFQAPRDLLRPLISGVFGLSCRDVDETISWIKEKEQLMASDDFGRDLASVQALLRKHEGLERDLAALEDKVRTRHEGGRAT